MKRTFIQSKGRTGKNQVWEVVVKGNAVTLTWGQQGGAMQNTTQTFEGVSVGKTNFKTPEEVAQNWAERQVLLQTRKGYVEVKDGKFATEHPGDETGSDINWDPDGGLPLHLRFFKPQNSLNAHCEKLIKEKKAILLRKRDGMMHSIFIGADAGMAMYSSTMAPGHKDEPDRVWLERYPHLIEELGNLGLPPKTVLLGELCTGLPGKWRDEYGMAYDDFTYVSGIAKSLTPLALEKQKRDNGRLSFCIWDIGYWKGECALQTMPAKERFQLIEQITLNGTYVTMPERAHLLEHGISIHHGGVLKAAMDYATDDVVKEVLEFAKMLKWEGFVVIDGEAGYGDKALSFHGKADRPKFVCKLKPKLEADFIARWDPDNGIGAWGKGKKAVGVGSVYLYLWDPEKEEEVFICEAGGGLTDEDVKKYADKKLYPLVFQIEFDSWTPKGALRFPVFVRERDDKEPEECLITQRPAAEEEDT